MTIVYYDLYTWCHSYLWVKAVENFSNKNKTKNENILKLLFWGLKTNLYM